MSDFRFLELVKLENPAWEMVQRKGKVKGKDDAVIIIPVLTDEAGKKQFILVIQPRPPTEGNTIEFPAGLIDEGENATFAAARELVEETGYICDANLLDSNGKVKEFGKKEMETYSHESCQLLSDLSFPSPGLTNESFSFVHIDVSTAGNDSTSLAVRLSANKQAGENTQTILAPLENLSQFLIDQKKANPSIRLDAKVQVYAHGLEMAFSSKKSGKKGGLLGYGLFSKS